MSHAATLIHYLAQLRERMSYSPSVMLTVLGCLLLAGLAALAGSRLAALALVPLSVAWVLSNQLVEGPVLVIVTWKHGITAADLLSAAALLVAGWRLTPPVLAVLDGDRRHSPRR